MNDLEVNTVRPEPYQVYHTKIRTNSNKAYINWIGPTMPEIFLDVTNPNGRNYISFRADHGLSIKYLHGNIIDEIVTPVNYTWPTQTSISFAGQIQGGIFTSKAGISTLYTPSSNNVANKDWSTPSTPLQGSLTILGENPPKEEVIGYLNTSNKIIINLCKVLSDFKMFNTNGEPNYNESIKGYGLFSLTQCSSIERWNWKKNLDSGIEKYNNNIKKSIEYSNEQRSIHKGLPALSDFQLSINAAQLFENDHYWVPAKIRFFLWKRWKWVKKMPNANRIGDKVQNGI